MRYRTIGWESQDSAGNLGKNAESAGNQCGDAGNQGRNVGKASIYDTE